MNPEARRLWVEALRSGYYPQGTEFLCLDGKWCCYGVLCDVAIRQGVRVEVDGYNPPTSEFGERTYDGCGDYPPEAVRKWAGFTTPDPTVPIPEELRPDAGDYYESIGLAALNDDYGFDFNRLAELIEEHL